MTTKPRPKKRAYGLPKLEMTPMIDVVFLLLIFFIVTLQPQEILATLDISEKAPQKDPPQEIPPTLEISVRPQAYVVGSVRMDLPTIDRTVERLRRFSKNTTMKIYAHPYSSHERLIRLLDLCEKHDLNNVVLMKQPKG